MAEKEERILITKCSSWCHARRMSCDPFDDKDGMYCDKSGKWVRITEKECAKCKDPVLLGIGRQEVIEKMAKAICNMGDEETWERVDDNYRHYCTAQAKWALNALLEEGKDA